MRQTPTSSTLVDGEPHVWIQRDERWPTCGQRTFNETRPKGLEGVDNSLWRRFKRRVNEAAGTPRHGTNFTVGMFVLGSNGLVAYVVLDPHEERHGQPETVEELGENAIGNMLVFCICSFFFLGILGVIFIACKHMVIDHPFRRACDEFKLEFRERGYGIEYRTLHTGICRPKYVKASRVIAFPRLPQKKPIKDPEQV
mmetsp:Transcript_19102/g.29036  ORF Transcript_19102/g.29036 Transcript_19102/m.29036 type:complete len:198 (-) Transcript_19102:112-705(-)